MSKKDIKISDLKKLTSRQESRIYELEMRNNYLESLNTKRISVADLHNPSHKDLIQINRYIPAMCSGLSTQVIVIDDVSQLREASWIKSWMDKDGFHRLSVADNNSLMVECNNGEDFYVIGTITDSQQGALLTEMLGKWRLK